ncbi:MAG: DUF1566 domain-containing protein [Treponema sp.]|jgi:hypothetical protein|nr:DUF1566 domain-containing protein [Treponema sp.]
MKAYYGAVVALAILPCSCVLEGGPPGPAGGYVFYDKGVYSDGWRYMECAPEDVGGDDIDWDQTNTLCEEYALNGYDDWYLPTIQELKWMYYNLHKKGMGNFKSSGSDYYWFSSEGYYDFSFNDGVSQDYYTHNGYGYQYYVRPVRKF